MAANATSPDGAECPCLAEDTLLTEMYLDRLECAPASRKPENAATGQMTVVANRPGYVTALLARICLQSLTMDAPYHSPE
jgi:hypothetical protein